MAKREAKVKGPSAKATKQKKEKDKDKEKKPKTGKRSSSAPELPQGRFHFLDLTDISSLRVSGEQTVEKKKTKKSSKGSLPDLRSGTPNFVNKDIFKSSKRHLKDASRYYLNPKEINSIKMTGLVYRAGKACPWAPDYATLQTEQRKILSAELVDMIYDVINNDKELRDAWWDCCVDATWPSDESVVKATVKAYLLTHCLRTNAERINKEAMGNRLRQAILRKGVKLSELTNSNVIGELNVTRESTTNPIIVNTNQALETEISDLLNLIIEDVTNPDWFANIMLFGDTVHMFSFKKGLKILHAVNDKVHREVNQALCTAVCFKNVNSLVKTTNLSRGSHEGVTATVLYQMKAKDMSKQSISVTSVQFLELVRNLLVRFMLQISVLKTLGITAYPLTPTLVMADCARLRIDGVVYKNGKPCTWRGRNGTFFTWTRIRLERELCDMIDKAIEGDELLCGIYITCCVENLQQNQAGHVKANLILLVNDSSLARNLLELKVPLHTAIASYGLKPKPVKVYRLISVDEVKRIE